MIAAPAVNGRPAAGAAGFAHAPPAAARVETRAWPEPDARWSLLLICVSVYLLSAVARLHQILPAFGAVRPALLSAAATLLLIALDPAAMARTRAALGMPGVRWLIALLFWAALSVPLALHPGGALDLVMNSLLKAVAMVVVTVVAVRGVSDLRRIVLVFFACVTLYAIMAAMTFPVDPSVGRLHKLVYYDANEFALLAACSLPYGMYLVWRSPWMIGKAAIVAALGLIFTTFVACGSRGGFLALVTGLVATVTSLRVIKLRWRVTALAVILAAFIVGASEAFWTRMDTVTDTQTDYNLTSPTGRVAVWKRGLGYMLDNPLLGIGGENFPTAEGLMSEYAAARRARSVGVKWSAAHNTYVQVGAELGVPGLVFFCAALFGSMLRLRRLSRTRRMPGADRELIWLASASLIALLIFAVGAVFLSLAYHDMLFLLLAISFGVQIEARRRAKWARLAAA